MMKQCVKKMVFYTSSMRCLAGQLEMSTRRMSSLSASANSEAFNDPFLKWNSNPRFPLPGNCAIDESRVPIATARVPIVPLDRPGNTDDLMDVLRNVEDKSLKMFDTVKQFSENQQENGEEHGQFSKQPSEKYNIECSIQNCPSKLRKGIVELFPGKFAEADDLTVLTICKQTESDMTAWSEEVEEEREAQMEQFVEQAKVICEELTSVGYWADFIDPSSGKAYLGEHTNATLFETDDRFNMLGFRVVDLGCCKVVRHPSWGTNVFIGTIFTTTPADSELFELFKLFLQESQDC